VDLGTAELLAITVVGPGAALERAIAVAAPPVFRVSEVRDNNNPGQSSSPEQYGTYAIGHPLENDGSNELYPNTVRVRRKGLDVGSVTSDDCPARLGDRHDEGIDRGTGSGSSPQLGCSPCRRLTHRWVDDAHFQESVGVGVASRIAT
jgi:hypothetical protein